MEMNQTALFVRKNEENPEKRDAARKWNTKNADLNRNQDGKEIGGT